MKKCTLVSYSFIIICNDRKAFTRRNSEVSGSSSIIVQEHVDVVKEKDEIDSNGHIEGHIQQKKRRKSSQGKNLDQMKGEKFWKHFLCYLSSRSKEANGRLHEKAWSISVLS